MIALIIAALSALAVALLIAAGVGWLLAWAYRTAADETAEERDDARDTARALRDDLADARWYLAAAEQGERKARRDLATARAELHYLRRVVTASAALTPDSLPDDWWSTAADIAALPATDREMPR
ncbi:hypothetical protein ACFYUR_21880 [Micromonospora haikouensis]|uniref:hypothetical protein n=1 Tax=Micromonospora haikouensis TaxID=686309 RepID=UPI003695EB61